MKMFDDMSVDEQNAIQMIQLYIDEALEYLHTARDDIINYKDDMVGGEFELEKPEDCVIPLLLAKEYLDRIDTDKMKIIMGDEKKG